MPRSTSTLRPATQLSRMGAKAVRASQAAGVGHPTVAGEAATGEASIASVATPPRRSRPFLLRISLSAEERRRLPNARYLSHWAREVLLQAAAGKRVVGPDLPTLQYSSYTRAWLGSLLDELLQPDTSADEQLRVIETAAELLAESPSAFEEGAP